MENSNENNKISVIIEYSDEIGKSPCWVHFDGKPLARISKEKRKVEEKMEVENGKEIPVELWSSIPSLKITDPDRGIFAETRFTFEKGKNYSVRFVRDDTGKLKVNISEYDLTAETK